MLAKKLTQLRERRLHVGFPETHAEREERVLVFVDGPLLEVVHLGDAEVGVVFIVVPFENQGVYLVLVDHDIRCRWGLNIGSTTC